MMKHITIWLLLVSIVAALLIGCAGTTPRPETTEDFVWPLPPDPPKIRYIKSLHSELDLGPRKLSLAQKIFESLFGRPRLRAIRKPLGVHVDKRGRVYVVDTHWRKVIIFDFQNREFKLLGEKGRGLLLNPLGVTTDNKGNIYVSDAGGFRIIVYKPDGTFLTAFGGKDVLVRPVGLAVNSKLGLLYVVDAWAHQIKVFFIKSGKLLFSIGKKGEKLDKIPDGMLDQVWNRGDGKAEFRFPTNIAIDPDGNIYVVDTMNFRVQILSPKGEFIRSFGKVGNIPGTFSRPKGIGLDSEGHIYVADAAFNNVQVFDKEGKLLLFFGNFGSGLADLRLPAGLYVDSKDYIYVVDQLNHRIQVYQYLSQNTNALGD